MDFGRGTHDREHVSVTAARCSNDRSEAHTSKQDKEHTDTEYCEYSNHEYCGYEYARCSQGHRMKELGVVMCEQLAPTSEIRQTCDYTPPAGASLTHHKHGEHKIIQDPHQKSCHHIEGGPLGAG